MDWRSVFDLLLVPSLFNGNQDVRGASIEGIVKLDHFVGNGQIRSFVESDYIQNLKPNIRQQILQRMGAPTPNTQQQEERRLPQSPRSILKKPLPRRITEKEKAAEEGTYGSEDDEENNAGKSPSPQAKSLKSARNSNKSNFK